MAVHCGVCACRISNASENDGAFSTAPFGGWDSHLGGDVIRETCVSCGPKLREAVAKAASEIVKENMAHINQLRKDIWAQREGAKKLAEEKSEFEREWVAKQRAKP